MAELRDYNPLASGNTATPPGGFAVGTRAGLIGGTIREIMSRLKRFSADLCGELIATGSGGTYVVATSQSAVLLPGMRVSFYANHQNPNSSPLANIGGTGDREIVYADGSTIPAGAIKAGQFLEVVWDASVSKWKIHLVPASQFAGTVTGAQIDLTGQAQGSIAAYGASGWYATGAGTTSDFFRGGPNPGWAVPKSLPGQALLAGLLSNGSFTNRAGMPYTAVASRQGTGSYRLLVTPSLPNGYVPLLTYVGSVQRMVTVRAMASAQVDVGVSHTVFVASGVDSLSSSQVTSDGPNVDISSGHFVAVVII